MGPLCWRRQNRSRCSADYRRGASRPAKRATRILWVGMASVLPTMKGCSAVATTLPKVFIVGGGFAGVQAAKAWPIQRPMSSWSIGATTICFSHSSTRWPVPPSPRPISACPSAGSSATRRTAGCCWPRSRAWIWKTTACTLSRGALPSITSSSPPGPLTPTSATTTWAPIAPGLKSIEDAIEFAAGSCWPLNRPSTKAARRAQPAALTFAIVGGGPTGVELAGAIKEIAAQTIPREFKHIDTRTTRVILFEAGDRLLPALDPELSDRAKRDLEHMGVEVHLNAMVTNITPQGISVGPEFTPVHNVFWAAGVKASPLGKSLGVPLDRAGRVIVGPDLTIPGHPEVFVTGDMAAAKSADTGQSVPGVAQGGMQMGRYAGRVIAAEIAGRSTPATRKPFRYHDKGTIATIGKAKAVAQIGRFKIAGLLAWLLWGGIHIFFLIDFQNRVQVLISWFWNWLINARDARLITGDSRLHIEKHRPGEVILAQESHSDPSDTSAAAGSPAH